MVFEKFRYIKQLEKYHKRIEGVLKENFGIDTVYLEVIAWGYSTTTFYIKSTAKDYVLRLSKLSDYKIKKIEKDILVTQWVGSYIPTAVCVRNSEGSCYTIFEDKIIRVTDYIEGVAPFDVDMDVFSQSIGYLKKIHEVSFEGLSLPRFEPETGAFKLLHGDLTPSNTLISHGKIVGIVDFEESMIGPPEWDISRAAVFYWFRMNAACFEEVLQSGLDIYGEPLDKKFMLTLAKSHTAEHYKNVCDYKERYRKKGDWKQDRKFSKERLEEISKISSFS